jgi:hypothetical protein
VRFHTLFPLLLGGHDRHATSGSVTRASRFLTGSLTHADALGGPVTDPGLQTKPSWYMVTTEDRMIPGTPVHHVPADWVVGNRGCGQSLRFRIATGRRGGPHQTGCVGRRGAAGNAALSPRHG